MKIKLLSIIIWAILGALLMFGLCCVAVLCGAKSCPVLNTMMFGASMFGLLRVAYFMGLLRL